MEYLIRHACDVKDCPALSPLYMGKANYIIANMLMKTNSEDAASSSLSSLLCHTVTERVVRSGDYRNHLQLCMQGKKMYSFLSC